MCPAPGSLSYFLLFRDVLQQLWQATMDEISEIPGLSAWFMDISKALLSDLLSSKPAAHSSVLWPQWDVFQGKWCSFHPHSTVTGNPKWEGIHKDQWAVFQGKCCSLQSKIPLFLQRGHKNSCPYKGDAQNSLSLQRGHTKLSVHLKGTHKSPVPAEGTHKMFPLFRGKKDKPEPAWYREKKTFPCS